jgi:hypothetical protein
MMQALHPPRIWATALLLAAAMSAGSAFAGGPSACEPCGPAYSANAAAPANVKVYVCAREAHPRHGCCCCVAAPQAAVVAAPAVTFAAPQAAMVPTVAAPMAMVPVQTIGWMYLTPQPVVQPMLMSGAAAECPCVKGKTLEDRVSSLERSMESLERSVGGLKDCMTLQQDSIEQLRKRAAAK